MGYVKQNFVDGQVLTASQLNHMEDGIAATDNMIRYDVSQQLTASQQNMVKQNIGANILWASFDETDSGFMFRPVFSAIADYNTAGKLVLARYGDRLLSLISLSENQAVFQSMDNSNAVSFVVDTSNVATKYESAYATSEELAGLAPLYVTVTGTDTTGYTASHTHAQIKAAYDEGRGVYCVYNNSTVLVPTGINSSMVMFQTTLNSTYRRIYIYADGRIKNETIKFALTTDLDAKADVPAATDEIYFDITADGVISLKPEYRGAATGSTASCYSDNGKGRDGTQNKELPEEIIIPGVVNGITVTALAMGMFRGNKRVKRIVLPNGVTSIPAVFCDKAFNLEEVANTENITALEQQSFAQSGLRKAYFPNLTTAGTTVFQKCANLAVVDLGNYFAGANKEVPAYFFNSCEKLTCLRNAEGIALINGYGMYGTKRITSLPVENLTAVGAYGLTFSRADYAGWGANSFGTMSNSTWINNTAYTPYTGSGCSTPLVSTFNQNNPKWADKGIGNTTEPYSSGCMTLCAAMAYSALMGVEMDSPEEFVAKVGEASEDLLDIVIDLPSNQSEGFRELETWLQAVDLNVDTHYNNSDADIQAMYAALESGAVVIARTYGGYDRSNLIHLNHIVLFRGINADGELLVVDPSSASSEIGIYEAATFAMPVQNLMRDATGAANTGETIVDGFVIVTKE